MGQSKAFLTHPSGETFIDHLISVYAQCRADQICVVIQARDLDRFHKLQANWAKSVQIVVNPEPERGRLSSVQTGLQAIPDNRGVFIQNVDNPFCVPGWLAMLAEPPLIGTRIPVCESGGGHPILISAEVGRAIQAALPDAVLKDLILQFPLSRIVISDPRIRANVNTPEEYVYWMGYKYKP